MMPQDTVFIFNIVYNNIFYYLFLTKILYSSLRPGRDEVEACSRFVEYVFLKMPTSSKLTRQGWKEAESRLWVRSAAFLSALAFLRLGSSLHL